MSCIGTKTENFEPFGNVPAGLSKQMKRSFEVTRTFVEALNSAVDVLGNMKNVNYSLLVIIILLF